MSNHPAMMDIKFRLNELWSLPQRILHPAAVASEDTVVNHYLKTGDLSPLLQALLERKIVFKSPRGLGARSAGGHLAVENDLYFYSYLLGYSMSNLVPFKERVLEDRITCACIRLAFGEHAAVSDESLCNPTKTPSLRW